MSPALMVPRPSPFHSVFRAKHGREANSQWDRYPPLDSIKYNKKRKKNRLFGFFVLFFIDFYIIFVYSKIPGLEVLF